MLDIFQVLQLSESVQHLAQVLLETPHGGFPVVKKLRHGDEVFIGLITRYLCDKFNLKEGAIMKGLLQGHMSC